MAGEAYGFPRDITNMFEYTLHDEPDRQNTKVLELNINNSQRREILQFDGSHYTVGHHTVRVDAEHVEGNPKSVMFSSTLRIPVMNDLTTPVRATAHYCGTYPTTEYERMTSLGVQRFDGDRIEYSPPPLAG